MNCSKDKQTVAFDSRLVEATAERRIEAATFLSIENASLCVDGELVEIKGLIKGDGVIVLNEKCIVGSYNGDAGSYQLRLELPTPLPEANGVTICVRVSGWEIIRYLAIGHTSQSHFRHVKIVNLAQEQVLTFSVGYQDLAYGLQNSWESPVAEAFTDIRLYLNGTPSTADTSIELVWVSAWLETSVEPPSWIEGSNTETLITALKEYFIRCNPFIDQQAKDFLSCGNCPLIADSKLHWPITDARPDSFHDSGTYRYLWHAMQPAISLMVYAVEHESLPALFAARDFVSHWLEQSFFNVDPDNKYTWYDHGVAERQLAFIFLHHLGIKHDFDYRFMSRLRLAMCRQAQLLESEAFYASDQPTRYHNHAWFQDMSLIATATFFPPAPATERWLDRAIERLKDQFEKLIMRDQGFAIFIENSIGYHHGVQRLVRFAGELVEIAGKKTDISAIAQELNVWSDFLRYPDGRSPSQGDTFRMPNSLDSSRDVPSFPYENPSCNILSKAGYAVVKGNHEGIPFMLCMFATTLSKTHKHEDNLSFTLFFDGVEWMIDPSFYSHDYTHNISSYLRSAWAHNNVVIPRANYSIQPKITELTGEVCDSRFELKGAHSAYNNYNVKRIVQGDLNMLTLTVRDEIHSKQNVTSNAYCLLQLGEGVQARNLGDEIQLSHSNSEYRLIVNGSYNSVEVCEGWNEAREVHGTTGLGYMQTTDRTAIALALPTDGHCLWCLNAGR